MKELKKVKKPLFSFYRHAYLIELSENKEEKNITYEKCENSRNLRLQFFDKTFVREMSFNRKITLSLKMFSVRVNFSFFHTVPC